MPKKSEARKPKKESKKLTQDEFEEKVIELAKTGLTSEKIGEKLRKEGVHSKEYNKKISLILKEKNFYINPDTKNIRIKLEKIEKHCEKNKQDKRAVREKDRIFSYFSQMKRYFQEA
ncbi:MAG: hypothetical protein AABX30_00600 [Nanoarchaeota archaeon]